MAYQGKVFKPVPPMKGSFPLDHDRSCRPEMLKYMKCLMENKYDSEFCRTEIKTYLECRMDNNLMAKESWEALGLKDIAESNSEYSS